MNKWYEKYTETLCNKTALASELFKRDPKHKIKRVEGLAAIAANRAAYEYCKKTKDALSATTYLYCLGQAIKGFQDLEGPSSLIYEYGGMDLYWRLFRGKRKIKGTPVFMTRADAEKYLQEWDPDDYDSISLNVSIK